MKQATRDLRPVPTGEQASRLPRRPEDGGRRVGQGLLALLGALVLLVGVPVALVALVGNPLPTSGPSRDWLTADVTPELVINVLAVLVWVVWAHFFVCFLAEWRAIRAGRMPGRVALGGGSQLLARKLVASLLLLSGGAMAAQGVAAMQAEVPDAPATSSATATVYDGYPAPMVSPDERAAIDAERPDAARESSDARRAVKHYEVKPPQGRHHDTLWDIAERTLGDPFRYKEIFELNQHRLQPDGSRLTDADLIRPGWQLHLPADASGPGVRTAAAPTSLPTPPTATGQTAGDASAVAQGNGASVAGTTDAGADVTDTLDAAGAADTADTADTAGTADTADGSRGAQSGLGDLLLGGGLVLAGIVRALTARRGPFGEPDTDDTALADAAALHRAELLDHALRGLAEMRLAQDAPMPEILFAYASDEQVVLHLAGEVPAPERPWTVSADGSSWSVHADEVVAPGPGTAAPYPSLVTVAESHGFDLLVDLERAPGMVALGGDTRVGRELAMAMALDLATHTWSDSLDVVMVGFGDELGDLDTQRVRHLADLDEVLAEAERGRSSQSRVSAQLGITGVLQGRQRGAAAQCAPLAVFLSGAPTSEQAQRIAALTGGGRTSFSVVCVGDSPSARWRFVVGGDGSFDAGVLGVSGTARRLTGDAQRRLEAMLAAAVERRMAGSVLLEETPAAELAAQSLGPVLAPASRTADGQDGGPAAGPDPRPVRTAGELASAPAVLRLLGPVEVQAPGHVDAARRDLLTEVVVMAALHGDGLHEAVLRASLWPRGVEQEVMDARLRDAAEWLGRDADGNPRLSRGDDGRWHVSDVAADYDVLVGAARRGDLDALLAALRLGTGEVFSGPGKHYSWLAFAREARQARLVATAAARRAAELAEAAGRTADVTEALRLGLALVPTAEVLWRMLLRLTAQRDGDAVDGEITQMFSVLAEHGVRPEPETDALVSELAPRRGGAVGT